MAIESYTIIGGEGFIGSAIARRLQSAGIPCRILTRGWRPAPGEQLHCVIYAVGVTGDFARRRGDMIDAHVTLVNEIMETATIESFLYLSSARVYEKALETREDLPIPVLSADPSDLYNLSKLTGEALCLARPLDTIRVARLSNVVGADFRSENFLTAIMRAAVTEGEITLRAAAESTKDYILLEDAVEMLIAISRGGKHRIYNVASGRNLSNGAIAAAVATATRCRVGVVPGSPLRSFPIIDITRLRDEFGFSPADVISRIAPLAAEFAHALRRPGEAPSSSRPPLSEGGAGDRRQ